MKAEVVPILYSQVAAAVAVSVILYYWYDIISVVQIFVTVAAIVVKEHFLSVAKNQFYIDESIYSCQYNP